MSTPRQTEVKSGHSGAAGPLAAPGPSKQSLGWAVALIVIVCILVLAVYWPTLSTKALFLDDSEYVTANRLVQNPSFRSVGTFFAEVTAPSTVKGYYQPLTMTSLMLDWAMGGRNDNLEPFRRTNLLLHTANTALVIVFLYLLFGNPWAAALAGLLFGVHPLTVESVPWLSERKTLLSAFFALWCLILYVQYARWSNWGFYVAALFAFVLAVLAKPISTMLPVVLLLLDFWPLRRLRLADFRRLRRLHLLDFWQMPLRALNEKFPPILVAVAGGIISIISQATTGGLLAPSRVALTLCHNIVFYLFKIVWPVDLTYTYPLPEPFSLQNPMILAGVIGTVVLVLVLLVSLRWTWALAIGWLVFFVAIFPTLGVLKFTKVIVANKYAYLPAIGLLMILALAIGWLWERLGRVRKPGFLRGGLIAVVFVLAGLEAWVTRSQLALWQDTEGLFRYTLKYAPHAAVLHSSLGWELARQAKVAEAQAQIAAGQRNTGESQARTAEARRKTEDAIAAYNKALVEDPKMFLPHNNLVMLLAGQGKFDEAMAHGREAIRLDPRFAPAYANLGRILSVLKRADEARANFEQAIEIDPHNDDAYKALGVLLAGQNRWDEAAVRFRDALRANGNNIEAYIGLSRVLRALGKFDEAAAACKDALKRAPDDKRVKQELRDAEARRSSATRPAQIGPAP